MSAGTGKTYGKNLFRRGTEIVPGAGGLFKLFQYAGNFHGSFSCAWQTEPDRLNFINHIMKPGVRKWAADFLFNGLL